MIKFDEYFALGHNCEVAFQLRRVLGRDENSFFSWGIFEIDALISLISTDFAGILESQNIGWDEVNNLPRDDSHGYSFHGPWSGRPHDDPGFLDHLKGQQQKASYLIHRFHNPKGRRCYFYKPPFTMPGEKVAQLADLLQARTPDAVLVLLRHADHTPTEVRHPFVEERILNRFAPVSDATDGHVASWDRVFTEFAHTQGLRIAYDTLAAMKNPIMSNQAIA